MKDTKKSIDIGNELVGAAMASGRRGINQYGGYVQEYDEKAMNGTLGKSTIKRITEQDDVIGAILYAIEILSRKSIPAWVPPEGLTEQEKAESQYYCDKLEEMRSDMDEDWDSFISSVIYCAAFGFSVFEVVAKFRKGMTGEPLTNSKFDDNLIGIRSLGERPQWTIDKWEFEGDTATAAIQQLPQGGRFIIPLEKCLHFKFRNRNGSPEGYTNLSNAYKSLYYKGFAESMEMVALERDAKGVPVMELPPEILKASNAATQEMLAGYKTQMAKFADDELKYMLIPSKTKSDGTPSQYAFTVLGRGSDKPMDYNTPIKRLEWRSCMLFLSQFLVIGSNDVGSYSLASSQTGTYMFSVDSFLNMIDSVCSRTLAPLICSLNGWNNKLCPRHTHGDVETISLTELGNFINAAVPNGVVIPDDGLESWVREQASMPQRQQGQASQVMPSTDMSNTLPYGRSTDETETEEETDY